MRGTVVKKIILLCFFSDHNDKIFFFRGNKNTRHASTYQPPPRYLDHSPDSYYEMIPQPPTASQQPSHHRHSKSMYSTSDDSDSDFATPMASPNRSPMLASKRHQLSCQDLRSSSNHHQLSSMQDLRGSSSQLSERRSQSAQRPGYTNQSSIGLQQRNIPPRKSLDPIPTPRKSSKNRASKYSNPGEPHYKSPSKVPIPVKGANQQALRSVQLLNLSTRIEDLRRDTLPIPSSDTNNSDESTCVEDSDTDTYAEIDIKPKREKVDKRIKTAEIRSIRQQRSKESVQEENVYEDLIPVKSNISNNDYNPYDEITPRVKRKNQKNTRREKDSRRRDGRQSVASERELRNRNGQNEERRKTDKREESRKDGRERRSEKERRDKGRKTSSDKSDSSR